MTRPHHPTPEAIELTEGEKDKIMNDFLLPVSLDFSEKTADQLTTYKLALAVAFEKCEGDKSICQPLLELYRMVEQAERDAIWEGQQLPWKD